MRKHKARIVACIYVLTIFGFAMLPGAHPTEDDAPAHFSEVLQNLLHIPLYGGLAFTLARAAGADATLSLPAAAGVVLTGLVVGLIDEWIQSHVPGRFVSWGDLTLDSIGLISVALAVRMRRLTRSRLRWTVGGMLGAGRRTQYDDR